MPLRRAGQSITERVPDEVAYALENCVQNGVCPYPLLSATTFAFPLLTQDCGVFCDIGASSDERYHCCRSFFADSGSSNERDPWRRWGAAAGRA